MRNTQAFIEHDCVELIFLVHWIDAADVTSVCRSVFLFEFVRATRGMCMFSVRCLRSVEDGSCLGTKF